MNENRDDMIPCQWMYTLEGNCREKNLIRKIMLIASILYGLLTLKEIGLISWRTYLRKIEYRKNWGSLDHVLIYALLFCILRSFDNFVVVFNLFPNAIIFRVSLFAISWIPGVIGIYFYLAGIFYAIPKLCFHRFTFRENNLWILNSKLIKPVLWILSLFTSIGLILSSISAGYFLGKTKEKEMIIAFSIQMLFFFFASFICWIILFYYGRVLIALTRESLELAGIDDELKKYDKENFNIHINKMKALNYAFGGICLLFAIFLIPITILYKKTLMQNFIINLLYFLICDVCAIIMVATIGFVIIYSEFKSRNIKKEKTDLSTSEFDNHNVT